MAIAQRKTNSVGRPLSPGIVLALADNAETDRPGLAAAHAFLAKN